DEDDSLTKKTIYSSKGVFLLPVVFATSVKLSLEGEPELELLFLTPTMPEEVPLVLHLEPQALHSTGFSGGPFLHNGVSVQHSNPSVSWRIHFTLRHCRMKGAIAAAFACDQVHYHVVFITHSAHEAN
ncbi:hypothetical protein Ccrd_010607, partial [Cynara cardunculus var. scolymus]